MRPCLRKLTLSPYTPPPESWETGEEDGEKRQNLFLLEDPEGYAPSLVLPMPLAVLVSLMDGKRTLEEMVAEFQNTTGKPLALEKLQKMVEQLDDLHYLESPAFSAFLQGEKTTFQGRATRPAAMTSGAYETSAEELEIQIRSALATPGKIRQAEGKNSLPLDISPARTTAAVVTHLDLERGSAAYGWVYQTLAERCDADTVWVLGTSHNPMVEPFALTTKGFETPFGVLETDEEMVHRIAAQFREKGGTADLFTEEFVHRDEHSIELQAIFLKYWEKQTGRKIRLVPMLVGSFAPYWQSGEGLSPMQDSNVAAMAEVISERMRLDGGKLAILATSDFAHYGPLFGDSESASEKVRDAIRTSDTRLLETVTAGDAERFWDEVVATRNRYSVCGVAPIYLLLKGLSGRSGVLLDYEQTVDDATHSCVSFAAVVF